MRRAAILVLMLAGPAYADNGSRDVRLLSADQVGTCTAVGTATNTRAIGRNPDEASQKALATAMDQAAKAGANAAVIVDGTSEPKHETVTLKTYRCGDGAGFNPAS